MNTRDQKNISVEKALKRGEQFLIAVPMYLVLLAIAEIIGLWYLDSLDSLTKLFYSLLIMTVPVIYRSIAVTYWYIWAFNKVRNVNELKRKSLKAHILFKKGSWLERIEFRTLHQKVLLSEIGDRLKLKDDIDYKDIYPESISIGFSKTKMGMALFYGAFFFVIGLWLLYDGNLWGFVLLGVGLFLARDEVRKLKRKDNQLRFDNKGIFSAEYGFVPWNKIRDASVVTIEGEYETSSLTYDRYDQDIAFEELQNELSIDEAMEIIEKWKESNPEGLEEVPGEEDVDETEDTDFESEEDEGYNESINIDELNIDASELRKIIKVYRNRYLQSLPKNK